MPKIVNIPKPLGKTVLTYLVISDLHSIYCNMVVLKKSIEMLKQVPIECRRIVLLGDIIDLELWHAKNPKFIKAIKSKDVEYFLDEFDSELTWFEMLISLCYEATGDYRSIYYAEGNHCSRVKRENFQTIVPIQMKHNFCLAKRMKFKQRGIHHIEYNDFFVMEANKSPKLYLTHGVSAASAHHKKHAEMVNDGSIIYGHLHQARIFSFKGFETRFSIANPAMCDLDPDYMGNKINDWSCGFTLINRTKDHITFNQVIAQDNQILDMFGRRF